MDDSGFPMTSEEIVETLVEIFQARNELEIAELLLSSTARIEETNYDNWNGGTYTYELMLAVPVVAFARLEAQLDRVEKSISETLARITRGYANRHLESVTITPTPSGKNQLSPVNRVPDDRVRHIWGANDFRLFLSHVSAHKAQVSELKRELRIFGISAFVAHEDIVPSREWQQEIELGLRSMHAIAALLTPDFFMRAIGPIKRLDLPWGGAFLSCQLGN